MTCLVIPATSAESVKLYGSLNELATYSQAAGIALSSTKLPATVRSVRLGSPAIYSGLAKGDKVTAASIDKGALNLTFQRNGHTYQTRVAVSPSALRAIQAQLDPASGGKPANDKRSAQASSATVEALKDYDIVFLVDRSGSMAETSAHGNSKWQWCEDHIAGFAREAENVLPDGVRMITFNTYADDHGILNASQVEDVFLNTHPAGGTDAASAIDRALSRFKERPMLLCVMTDGLTDERRLQAVLSKAAMHNTQNQMVSVAFFQIGEDPQVEKFLSNLPQAITAKSAALITYKAFGEILSTGLSKCLVDTIIQMKDANTPPVKSTK